MPRGTPRLPWLIRHRTGWDVAVPTVYGGHCYRSRAEARYAERLDLLLRAKQIRAWRRAPSFPLVVHGRRCGRYTPDFEVEHLDGKLELVEIKGRAARDFGLRFKVFRALYPERWISVLDGQGRPWKTTRPARRAKWPRA